MFLLCDAFIWFKNFKTMKKVPVKSLPPILAPSMGPVSSLLRSESQSLSKGLLFRHTQTNTDLLSLFFYKQRLRHSILHFIVFSLDNLAWRPNHIRYFPSCQTAMSHFVLQLSNITLWYHNSFFIIYLTGLPSVGFLVVFSLLSPRLPRDSRSPSSLPSGSGTEPTIMKRLLAPLHTPSSGTPHPQHLHHLCSLCLPFSWDLEGQCKDTEVLCSCEEGCIGHPGHVL